MNNAKEIAETIINSLVPEAPIYILARAYLELENEIETSLCGSNDKQEIISSSRAFGKTTKFINELQIAKYALKKEITKLKEENEQLRGLADFDAFSRENFNSINAKQSSEIVKLKAEIEKLKKSRDVLRKSIEWYEHESNWLYPEIRKDGSRMTKTIFVMREKAREAIKADDEIVGGVK